MNPTRSPWRARPPPSWLSPSFRTRRFCRLSPRPARRSTRARRMARPRASRSPLLLEVVNVTLGRGRREMATRYDGLWTEKKKSTHTSPDIRGPRSKERKRRGGEGLAVGWTRETNLGMVSGNGISYLRSQDTRNKLSRLSWTTRCVTLGQMVIRGPALRAGSSFFCGKHGAMVSLWLAGRSPMR